MEKYKIISFLLCFGLIKGSNSLQSSKKFLVELAVVCDKDFGDRFHHNTEEILKHWAILIRDVNLKFKTLPSVDISFQVSSLLQIKNNDDQPFVENARTANGSLSINRLLEEFAGWVNRNEEKLGHFHIAVLVSGTNFSEDYRTSSYVNGTCNRNIFTGRHESTLVLRDNVPWGESCINLEFSLGTLLGAPRDEYVRGYPHPNCAQRSFAMSAIKCGRDRFFFSECSNAAIAENLQYKTCLRIQGTYSTDILSFAHNLAKLPSLDEQCANITGNKKAVAVKGNSSCHRAQCWFQGYTKYTIYPPDNSPCGNSRFCFRGRCLEQGFQLKNGQSGKCLRSSNRFSSRDYPKLKNCLRDTTPLDEFRILNGSTNQTSWIATPYSSKNANENGDKCLTVDVFNTRLQYAECSTNYSLWLDWKLVRAKQEGSYFLLYHTLSKSCAAFHGDEFVFMDQRCDKNDFKFWWKAEDFGINAQVLVELDAFKSVRDQDSATTPKMKYDSSQKFETSDTKSNEYLRVHWDFWIILAILVVISTIVAKLIVHFGQKFWLPRLSKKKSMAISYVNDSFAFK